MFSVPSFSFLLIIFFVPFPFFFEDFFHQKFLFFSILHLLEATDKMESRIVSNQLIAFVDLLFHEHGRLYVMNLWVSPLPPSLHEIHDGLERSGILQDSKVVRKLRFGPNRNVSNVGLSCQVKKFCYCVWKHIGQLRSSMFHF